MNWNHLVGYFRHQWAKMHPGPAPDTTPPSIPQGLTIGTKTGSTIAMSWLASTDSGGSGLKGYTIQQSLTQNGVYTNVGTALAPIVSFVAPNLSYSTTYWFKVLAFDNVGNNSAASTAASGTTLANQAPVFTVAPATFAPSGLPANVQFTAVDPEGLAITYSLVGSPANISINSSTGLVTVSSGAVYQTVTVRAADPSGLSTDTSFTLNILTLNNPGYQSWTIGVPVSLQLVASGGGGTKTYSASGLPTSVTINVNTGLISGTPTIATTSSITATVTDTVSGSTSQTFGWMVQAAQTGLVFSTNFAGIVNTFNGRYNYSGSSPTGSYSAGDSYYFVGTDNSVSPVQVFNRDTPAIWGSGPYPVGNYPAGLWQNWIVSIDSRVNQDGIFLTPPNRYGLSMESLAVSDRPSSGETTAVRVWHKARYRQPDQLLWLLSTIGVTTANKMVYERFKVRFLSAARASSGVGYIQGLDSSRLGARTEPGGFFCVFIDHKYNESQTRTRAMLGIVWDSGANAYRMRAYNDVQTGGVTVGGVPHTAWYQWNLNWGPVVQEDVWYTVEFASRPGNTASRGLLFLAVNGTVYANTQAQSVGDGEGENWVEMMIFQNYQSDEIAGSQKEITGLQVYNAWPSDASAPHVL